MKKILVTGAAGFIGYHAVKKLCETGDCEVAGLDNINSYYDVNLKLDRLKLLGISSDTEIPSGIFQRSTVFPDFRFIRLDLCEKDRIIGLFENEKFDYIIHLASQAGVRYSLDNPQVYIESNIVGFFNLLEACRAVKPEHLIFASSSSVYGNNRKVPFSTDDMTDEPVSLYAATKKSNEVMAYAYASLYDFAVTGLRFFTVYGPYGRPDMAYFNFTKNISEGKPIKVFADGKLKRDFTYIDDITDVIMKLREIKPPANGNNIRYRIYNIGNNNPVEINYFIALLEKYIGKKSEIQYLPMQKGDVLQTYADLKDIKEHIGFEPSTNIEDGLRNFVYWFKEYSNFKSK